VPDSATFVADTEAFRRCLTELARHSRRMLPSGLGDPESDPEAFPAGAGPEVSWLQPVPGGGAVAHLVLRPHDVRALPAQPRPRLPRLLAHAANQR
jgi:hypothetical protein